MNTIIENLFTFRARLDKAIEALEEANPETSTDRQEGYLDALIDTRDELMETVNA